MSNIVVCTYCLDEVSVIGEDAIYVCQEHGIVEDDWTEVDDEWSI